MAEVGHATPLGALPRVGDEVDRYRVMGEIAVGGMAVVFAARRKSLAGFERLVALKVISPQLATDRYFVDMFLDEARIASRVHHANVVQVYDVVEHDGLPCIVMELLRGRSFAAVLRDTSLSDDLKLLVLARAAEGLSAAHKTLGSDGESLGIIHRDVSPENVHVGYDGHVKVVDFGIAAAKGRLSSTRTGELKGKLAYLSPEQITNAKNISDKVDVWGFCVMAWEAFAGEPLFRGEGDAGTMWNVVHREVPHLSACAPSLDPAVAEAIMAGLKRVPADRISMPELTAVLVDAASKAGANASSLSAVMQDVFADDKRRADQKLQRTLSQAMTRAGAASDGVRIEVVAAPEGEGATKRPRRVGTVAILLGVASLGAFFAGRSLGIGQDGVSAEPSVAEPSTASQSAAHIAPAAPEVAEPPSAPPPTPKPSVADPDESPAPDPAVAATARPQAKRPARRDRKPRRKQPKPPASTAKKKKPSGGLLDSPY